MRFVEDPAAVAWVRDYYPAQVYPDIAQFDMLRRWRHRVGEVVWCTALPRGEPAPRDDPLEDEEVEFMAGKSQDQSWDPRTRGPCGVNPVSRDVEVLLEGDEDDGDEDDDEEDDGGKGGGGGGSGGGKGPSDGGDEDEDGRPSDGGGKRSDETEDGVSLCTWRMARKLETDWVLGFWYSRVVNQVLHSQRQVKDRTSPTRRAIHLHPTDGCSRVREDRSAALGSLAEVKTTGCHER